MIECFVQLWLRLERTRQMFGMQYKRFCIRRVLQSWLGSEATDDFVWEVCFNTVVDEQQMYGYDILPAPALHPRASREFLRALVAVKLGIGMREGFGQSLFGGLPTQYAAECQQEEERTAVGWVAR